MGTQLYNITGAWPGAGFSSFNSSFPGGSGGSGFSNFAASPASASSPPGYGSFGNQGYGGFGTQASSWPDAFSNPSGFGTSGWNGNAWPSGSNGGYGFQNSNGLWGTGNSPAYGFQPAGFPPSLDMTAYNNALANTMYPPAPIPSVGPPVPGIFENPDPTGKFPGPDADVPSFDPPDFTLPTPSESGGSTGFLKKFGGWLTAAAVLIGAIIFHNAKKGIPPDDMVKGEDDTYTVKAIKATIDGQDLLIGEDGKPRKLEEGKNWVNPDETITEADDTDQQDTSETKND